jgi:hypothetical protein
MALFYNKLIDFVQYFRGEQGYMALSPQSSFGISSVEALRVMCLGLEDPDSEQHYQ